MVRRTLGAAAVLLFASCNEDPRYVYTAQKYDALAGCLNAYAPIETSPGDSVSATCERTCLTVGTDYYLSTLCPPVPANATEIDQSGPECQAMLRAKSCSREPETEPEDAGEER